MLDGWYCRTLASEQQAAPQNESNEQNMGLNDDTDSDSQDNDESRQGAGATNSTVDYKNQYRYLKRKLKFLIYVSLVSKRLKQYEINVDVCV